jgi:hypothetical protein
MSVTTLPSPIFMIEPLPNCFSIWASAAASAFDLLSFIAYPFPWLRGIIPRSTVLNIAVAGLPIYWKYVQQ